jgi:hypothetical protein
MDAATRRALAAGAAAAAAGGGALAWAGVRRRSGADAGPLRRSLTIAAAPDELRRLWNELPDEDTEGTIETRPGPEDWGTVVTLTVDAPDGRLSGAFAERSLRRLKSLAETGEVPTTERNPSARAD